MSERPEQEQIIDEAKRLNPDASSAFVSSLSAFLSSDLNKTELNVSSLRQLTENLLGKLAEPTKDNEN
jgi:hypothetical protein